MKRLILAFAMLPTPLFALDAHKSVVHVILVGGQSNAVGQESAKGLPAKLREAQENIPFYYQVEPQKGMPAAEPVYTTLQPGASKVEFGVGPEVSFGKKLGETLQQSGSKDRVAIIKYAVGGTNLYAQWKAGGDETTKGDGPIYRAFQKVVSQGLETLKADPKLKDYEIRTDAMLWVQGEADLGHDRAADYATNLTAFIGDVRATFGGDIEFYFSRISDSQTIYRDSKEERLKTNYAVMREKQAEVAKTVPEAFMVDIDGKRFSMLAQKIYHPLFLHFDAKGEVAIGEAFASAYIENSKSVK